MTIEVEYDLYRGTNRQQGVHPRYPTRKQIAFCASNVPSGTDSIRLACDAAIAGAPAPAADDGIPLVTASGWKFGSDQVFGVLYWEQQPITNFGNVAAISLARFERGNVRFLEWFRDTSEFTDGYPTGPIRGIKRLTDEHPRPRPYRWKAFQWTMYVPYMTTSDILATIDPVAHTMNGGNVTIGGKAFTLGQLLYLGSTVDVANIAGTVNRYGYHRFLYFKYGHFVQDCWFNKEGYEKYDAAHPAGTNKWVTKTYAALPPANWTGVFPT